MQHAMATKMTNIWHYAERHEQWKRVTLPACILKMYCRPGATAENMIQPITGLQSSSIPVRRFPKKLHRSTYLYICIPVFYTQAASRWSKSCLDQDSRIYSKIWLGMINIRKYLPPNNAFLLKRSSYEAMPEFAPFIAQRSKRPHAICMR